MRIINYIKIKTPSHYECRKERTKVTIALVRFYFYYYVEFFFFFCSFSWNPWVFLLQFLSFPHSQFFIYLFHPSGKLRWRNRDIIACQGQHHSSIQKAMIVEANVLWLHFRWHCWVCIINDSRINFCSQVFWLMEFYSWQRTF